MAGRAICRKGLHPMTPENVYVYPSGMRRCRECARAADLRRHARDREKRNALANRRYHANREEINRKRRAANYGMTVHEYDALLESQGGRCAICRTDEPGGKHNTHFMVDHDHETGEVRGFLCGACNVALGVMKDDSVRLRAAADYLDERGAE